ncbi:hypothetical protein [Olleya namhaensis]|uniref:hypothetical protein n=1 Tax=Olleya namhaensis TaxID=1144750 RepID=UPI002491265B|nr:hypothetical protein [Olleya namhaensis]
MKASKTKYSAIKLILLIFSICLFNCSVDSIEDELEEDINTTESARLAAVNPTGKRIPPSEDTDENNSDGVPDDGNTNGTDDSAEDNTLDNDDLIDHGEDETPDGFGEGVHDFEYNNDEHETEQP